MAHRSVRVIVPILVLLVSVALVACGEDSSEADDQATATTATSEPTTAAETTAEQKDATTHKEAADTPPEGCEKPARLVVNAIEEGLTVDGGGSLGAAYAVRSDDFDKVWMVAAEINGPDIDEIGVWATNEIRDYGVIYAADSFAREFSDWGSGQTSPVDDGIDEAKACFE